MLSTRSTRDRRIHRIRRTAVVTAMATVTAPMLAGCFLIPGQSAAHITDVQDVKAATMLIVGQGTKIQPGTLEPAEGAWIGTGWFFTPDGYAVTNNHVVTGAGSLKVYLGGDQDESRNAQVVSASECYDLAVIKVDTGDETAPFLGWYGGEITEGIEVYSAGYPGVLGAEYTLTKGIVSQADTSDPSPWADVEHAIEHDARIRGGNSGGPLINTGALVLGVNYAGSDESDSNSAIGRESAKSTIEKLKAGEIVLSLGLNLSANPPSETGAATGIWVTSVLPGGAADKAGIKPGDVIDSLNGVTMGESGVLRGYCDVLRTNGVDATLSVEVWRPSTGEILEGQINGTPIEVVGNTNGDNGNTNTDTVGSFVDIVDDTGSITVRVPDTWAQIDGAPYADANGATWYSLTASPDIAGYQSGFTTPGVSVSAAPIGTESPDAILAGIDAQASQVCTATAQAQPYADGFATGVYSYWSSCGGSTSDFAIIAATTDDGTAVLWVSVQMVSEFDKSTALDNILQSFFVQL